MTTNEVREYLKSYRNYKDRVTYIENKAIGRIGEPTIKNDYIVMKEGNGKYTQFNRQGDYTKI